MIFKTYKELPITAHCSVELPDPASGIFNTSIAIDKVTLMGYDISEMFTKDERLQFELDALDEYFDNQREAEEDQMERDAA